MLLLHPRRNLLGLLNGAYRLRVGVGVFGNHSDVLHAPPGGGHGHLARDTAAPPVVNDVGFDHQWGGAHGDHVSVDRQEMIYPGQALDLVAQELPQSQDKKITQNVVAVSDSARRFLKQ